MAMNSVLLLGAGFSRNWGGWLAIEAFEYLLGCPQIDAGLKKLLWDNKRRGGFEAALAELQETHFRQNTEKPEQRLIDLQDAILQMFRDMDEAFCGTDFHFEFQNLMPYQVQPFLGRFDAIFTLNQDALLERHYLSKGIVPGPRQWGGRNMPGLKSNGHIRYGIGKSDLETWTPDESCFSVSSNIQPYFKLHGSSNWVDSDAQELLVMGGNKASIIDRYPILKWNHQQFKEYLSPSDTRLMVIGYSFGDDHINNVIREAVVGGNLGIFVIDPSGVDVIDKNIGAQIYAPDEFTLALQPNLIGSSRRSLREIFGNDPVEYSKVMKFFS